MKNIESLSPIIEAISKDKEFKNKTRFLEKVSHQIAYMPIWCAFSFGLGNFLSASIFYAVYLIGMLYVFGERNKLKHHLSYIATLAQGKSATNKWEE